MGIEAMVNESNETVLRGVTLEDKPGAYKQNGHWVGIAHDVLELLQRVCFLHCSILQSRTSDFEGGRVRPFKN